MSIKKVEIDGKKIASANEVYELLKEAFFLHHELHSNNADALWDVMPGYVTEPTVVVWNTHKKSEATFGIEYKMLVGVLEDIAKSDDNFQLVLN